ncbi:MAG: CDP-glycerol glycerophosphotransferase family protein, partial [Acutalibacteraceae bacterium]
MSTSDDSLDDYGIIEVEKRNIWVFNSGLNFSGNPKWLFIYINKYRPDIKAFWLCSDEDTVNYINSLGYKAYLFLSKEGTEVATAAGVYVTEQCKEVIPENLRNCVYLNLYHGVGCKSIERKVNSGFLFNRIMKKYIVNNEFYLNNMLFLVTSPLMEEHFKQQVGVADDMVIRAGYPRCVYQQYYERVESFDHDILKLKGRNADTKVIVYAPTYRDNPDFDFVNTLLPDMAALEQKLADNNQLLIFKLHPLMQDDEGFKAIYEKYSDSPYFLFWNNDHDIYEIFDIIDTAIVDYSSIFYDFLAGGVKNFIRYFADYGTADLRDNVFDYKEMTCGRICSSFKELLEALDCCESDKDEETDRQRIYDLFWEYSGEDTMDRIIEAVLTFKIKKQQFPTLYTFDVFDTLISRKGLVPVSVFCKVKEQAASSGLGFSRHFLNSYIDIRKRCEANVREFWNKTTYVRNSDLKEISFDSIFERMKTLYDLSEEQASFLKKCELEAELEDCVAVPEMIAFAQSLVENGEDVMIISDMYLPSTFIKKLIGKFSEILTTVPMYVSCEYGVQKSSGLLFQEVYKDIDFYKYGEWIHYGDNRISDSAKPAEFGIKAKLFTAPVFNEYENSIIRELGTYDAYLVAAAMARFRKRNKSTRDYFSYAYVSLCLVPYTMWVIDDAQKRNIDTLYFVSRDGYHLKRIADAVISKLDTKIKAKYIYGSRKAWRIPSFINEFDESFFLPFGNLATVANYNDLLSALVLDEEKFEEFFPSLCDLKSNDILTNEQRKTAISVIEKSEEYRDYLLNIAAEERVNVEKYLDQEIDFDEKFAFVDYWGRGYTQTCLTRLVQDITKQEVDVPFYYVRSIYPSQGHNVRYNYTCKNTSMLFVEALFSNIDYKSIHKYCEDTDGKMIPVIEENKCDMQLLESMRSRLCSFARDFLDLDLTDRDSTLRALLDYSLEYFNVNQTDPVIVENLAPLGYSVTMFDTEREYAPKLTKEEVDLIADKKVSAFQITNSIKMSLARSDDEVAEYYQYVVREKPLELKIENIAARQNKKRQIKDAANKIYNYKFPRKS